MMASLVLNSIRSALNALQRSEDCIEMKDTLKNLEVFVLCARKLGNDDAQLRFDDGKVCTLASLFQRIHDALLATPYNWDWHTFSNFYNAIANLKEEIGGWYNTLLVSLPQPTFDEVTHIVDSVLDHLHLILKFPYYRRHRSIQPIVALIEKLTFLRNFICFATLQSVEPPQLFDNLLSHIHAVAVDAAHTSSIYTFRDYDVEPNVPVLLQMIKMVDPQVDETYTEALTSCKLSTHLLSPISDKDHDPSVIMKDFIDSLLSNLWERLHTDTPIIISTNSELQLVYEGLRLLRSMLKDQPNKFDKRIGELTRVVICDAGILIFSLYHREMEIVVPASGLLQRINRITQTLKGKDFSIPDLLQRISRVRQRVEGKDLSIPYLLQRIHHAREPVGGNDLPRTNPMVSTPANPASTNPVFNPMVSNPDSAAAANPLLTPATSTTSPLSSNASWCIASQASLPIALQVSIVTIRRIQFQIVVISVALLFQLTLIQASEHVNINPLALAPQF